MAANGTEKPMACWNCPRYERGTRQCRDGKCNPRKKADSVTVAETLGLRALCHYNLYRDGLAARMHFPRLPIAASIARPRVRRGDRRGKIEIEIEASTDVSTFNTADSSEAETAASHSRAVVEKVLTP